MKRGAKLFRAEGFLNGDMILMKLFVQLIFMNEIIKECEIEKKLQLGYSILNFIVNAVKKLNIHL